ncbi:MAG: NAD(P)/FAD-dependent oxidoreductase [Mesorhizobium sp.]
MTSSSKSSYDRFDVVVIGGGHNGIVAAATLARAGRKVALVEASNALGGPARTEEFHPGFRASTAHILNRLHPEVIGSLDLARYGLKLAADNIAPTSLLSTEQPPLILRGGWGEQIDGDLPDSEKRAWAAMRAQLMRYANVLKPFLTRMPPGLDGMGLAEKLSFGSAALAVRRLGKEDMRDFLRMMLMNVHDVADEHLSDDRLKGLLAFDATLGSHFGPRSPTSLLGLYYRLTGEVAGQPGAQVVPAGGMGAVIAALEASARASGVDIRTGAIVQRVVIEGGRATGVGLTDGCTITAGTVVSAMNPATTMIELVGPRSIDTGIVRKAGNIRMKGDVAKLHLALDGLPEFTGLPADAIAGRLVIAPSSDYVELAFNPSKYGEFSTAPAMEIILSSVSDPSLAPAGKCVLSANIQFAPYALKEGWTKGKPKFLKAVMAVLEAHAPGIGGKVIHAELLTPADIEARYLMPGGHWHHGELQVDQMLVNRPFFGAERYQTPVDGLWLASAGSHPGGGISGVPGLNAARAILKVRR